MIIEKNIKLTALIGDKLQGFQKRLVVTANTDLGNEREIEDNINKFIKSYDDKILIANGLSECVMDNDRQITTDGFVLKYPEHKKDTLKIMTENSIGSFSETFKRELVNGIFRNLADIGIDYYAVDCRVDLNNHEDSIEVDEVPMTFFAALGGELKSHDVRISWEHNPFFSSTCASCTSGNQHLMTTIDFLNGQLLYDKETEIKGEFKVGSGLFIPKDTNVFKSFGVDKMNDYQDLVNWFTNVSLGAIEMAHVQKMKMRVGYDVYEAHGTDE